MLSFFKKFSYQKNNQHIDPLPSIVIKIPVNKWKRAYSWGDTHMAILLKEQLELLGHRVLIQVRSEWYNREGRGYNTVIVFRGLKEYKTNPDQKNIMWNISHPEKVSIKEYNSYDFVYIASNYWKSIINQQATVPISAMLQCTDPNRFKPFNDTSNNKFANQLLFVGNSRGIYRKIIKDILPTKYKLTIYGEKWEKLIPKQYIKGQYIDNKCLYKYYSSTEILLNDHWEDMRNNGFVSNRIFDGLACQTFIITDNVEQIGDIGEYVQTYKTKKELELLIDYFLKNPKEREKKAIEGLKYVLEHHTFQKRAKQFSDKIKSLHISS